MEDKIALWKGMKRTRVMANRSAFLDVDLKPEVVLCMWHTVNCRAIGTGERPEHPGSDGMSSASIKMQSTQTIKMVSLMS